MTVRERLCEVRERVMQAATSVGRDPDDITLIAVSKRQPIALVLDAYEEGVRDFGESTAQGLVQRVTEFRDHGIVDVRWHFVGHLQRNKVKMVAGLVHRIHSVDRWSLVEEIQKRERSKVNDLLVQVNLGAEEQKRGVGIEEVVSFCERLSKERGIRFRGLMALPPVGEDVVPFFLKLRSISEVLKGCFSEGEKIELSMGMTGDYKDAVHCGATHIRVGTGVFGSRS